MKFNQHLDDLQCMLRAFKDLLDKEIGAVGNSRLNYAITNELLNF